MQDLIDQNQMKFVFGTVEENWVLAQNFQVLMEINDKGLAKGKCKWEKNGSTLNWARALSDTPAKIDGFALCDYL